MKLFLDYQSCKGLNENDKYCHIAKSDINPQTGKAFAINPSTGAWDDTYFSEVVEKQYKASNPSLSDLAAETQKLYDQSIQPAVTSLEQSKTITGDAYAERSRQLTESKPSLSSRYQNLISQITQRETADIDQLTTQLSREYGARGIPLSSGAFSQDLMQKQAPVKQFYTSQSKDVQLEESDKLRSIDDQLAMLPVDKAKDLNAIDQMIGQLKAQSADKSIALSYQAMRDAREEQWNQKQFELEQQKFQLSKYQAEQPSYSLVNTNDKFGRFDERTGIYEPYSVASLQKQSGGGSRYSIVG